MLLMLAAEIPAAAAELEIVNQGKDLKSSFAALVFLLLVLEVLRRRSPSADLRELEDSRRTQTAIVEESRRADAAQREVTIRHAIDRLGAAPSSNPPPSKDAKQ